MPDRPRLSGESTTKVMLRTLPRIVALCDILGLKEMLRSRSLSDLAAEYSELIATAAKWGTVQARGRQRWRRKTVAHHVVFSDTILLWSQPATLHKPPPILFHEFLPSVGMIFVEAIKRGLPMRVGIAYGPCIVSPSEGVYLGQPIVDAHLTEQAQDWIGVACHPSCVGGAAKDNFSATLDANASTKLMIEYDIPLKEPKPSFELRHSINWMLFGLDPGIGETLRAECQKYSGTTYEARWRRTLDFFDQQYDFTIKIEDREVVLTAF
jgi:hypothetical protein